MNVLSHDEMTRVYDIYLCDIEAYFRRELSRERLVAMLVGMANDGFAFRLSGALRDELDRMVATGEIVGVIQPAWDELNECVLECAFEKVYFTREDAAWIQAASREGNA